MQKFTDMDYLQLSSKIFEATPDTIYRRLEDEIVVINLASDKIFNLNLTGARFWELLTSGITLNQVKNKMLDEFEVPEATLTDEIIHLLKNLIQEGLIRVQE